MKKQVHLFIIHFLLLFASIIFMIPKASAQATEFGVNLSGMEWGGTPQIPTAAEMKYYSGKGLKLIRLPFLWEYVQPTLGGSLNASYLAEMDGVIAAAASYNMSVMIDMHNYCRYPYNGSVITSSGGPTQAQYNYVWTLLATHYVGNTTVWGYDIMNEPNTLGGANWFNIAQGAITAIRGVDTQHTIVVEGDNWSQGNSWTTYNNNLYTLSDPSKNLVFEAHQYFDNNQSGAYSNNTMAGNGRTVTSGVTLITPFVNWVKTNNVRGMVGEYAVPNNADATNWNTLLYNFLQYLQNNCVLGTYWGGGPGWNSSNCNDCVEPLSNFTVDQPMMPTLVQFTNFISGCSPLGTICRKPALGADLSTCSGTTLPVTLNANAGAAGNGVSYKWYTWNGTSSALISGQTAETYSASSLGSYIVERDSSTCSMFDTLTISNTMIKPNLGADVNLCNPATANLSPSNAAAFPTGTSWQCKSATTLSGPYTTISGQTASSINNIRTAGFYLLQATAGSCKNSDTIQVTSSLPTPVDACGTGTVTLSISNAGSDTYNWYDAATGGNLICTGTSSCPVTSPATLYVQDMSSTSGTVGPTAMLSGAMTYANSSSLVAFTLSENVTVLSIQVPLGFYYLASGGDNFNVTVSILNASGGALTPAQTFTSNALAIPANAATGLYTFTFSGLTIQSAWGTNLTMSVTNLTATGGSSGYIGWFSGSAYSYPYNSTPSGVVTITGAYDGGTKTTEYGSALNWHVQTGTPCSRLPVVATNTNCITTAVQPDAQVSQINVYPNPAKEVLNIRFPDDINGTAYLIDLQGNMVLTQTIQGSQSSISTTSLQNGMYVLKVVSQTASYIKQVVIAK